LSVRHDRDGKAAATLEDIGQSIDLTARSDTFKLLEISLTKSNTLGDGA
jgi:hypothetical protein